MSANKEPGLTRMPELSAETSLGDALKENLCPERMLLIKSFMALFKRKPKEPYVLALDAGWGTGKTFTLGLWQKYLHSIDHPCLKFSAWDYDHTESPILSFMTALELDAEKILPNQKTEAVGKAIECFTKKIKAQIPSLVGGSIRLGLSCLPFGEIANTLLGAVAEKISETALESSFDALDESKRQIAAQKKFSEALQELASELGSKNAPVVIMIDELDRCRPDFAIRLLEDIKHLFSVPGVVFFLAVEKEQLARTVSAVYGLDDKGAMVYLDKFIDMTVRVPSPEPKKFISHVSARYPLSYWPRDWGIHHDSYPPPNFAQCVQDTIAQSGLSLRSMYQVMARMSILPIENKECSLVAGCLHILICLAKGHDFEDALSSLKNFKLTTTASNETFYADYFSLDIALAGAIISKRDHLLVSEEWEATYGKRWKPCMEKIDKVLKNMYLHDEYDSNLKETLSLASLIHYEA